jgi:hypothetical protein
MAALAAQAETHFQRAEAAMKAGDLTLWAEEIAEAREIVRKMAGRK